MLSHGYDVLSAAQSFVPRLHWHELEAHLGFAVCIIGIAVTSTQSRERDVRMVPQDRVELDDRRRMHRLRCERGQRSELPSPTRDFCGHAMASSATISLRPEKRQYLEQGAMS